jgi:DNA-directed RNA polymerase subunit RPC12/RpoP
MQMVPFTYRCSRTGQQVQGWATDDLADGEIYEPVTCTACGRVHLVNRKSGKVLEETEAR